MVLFYYWKSSCFEKNPWNCFESEIGNLRGEVKNRSRGLSNRHTLMNSNRQTPSSSYIKDITPFPLDETERSQNSNKQSKLRHPADYSIDEKHSEGVFSFEEFSSLQSTKVSMSSFSNFDDLSVCEELSTSSTHSRRGRGKLHFGRKISYDSNLLIKPVEYEDEYWFPPNSLTAIPHLSQSNVNKDFY